MATPLWALRILVDELPALEAADLAQAAQAATVPHMKDGDRRGLWHELKAAARPRGRRAAPPELRPAEPRTHDPAAAAAFFASQGIRVRKVDAS